MKLTVFYDHILQACRQTGKPIEQIAEILTVHGISGVEIDGSLLRNEDGMALVQKLSDMGLAPSCAYIFYNFTGSRRDFSYKNDMKILAKCGIKKVLAIAGFTVGEGERAREKCKRRVLSSLKAVCKCAKRYGVQVFVEDYDASNVVYGTAEEVKYFLDRIPYLKCAFDTGNFFHHGADELEAFELLCGKTVYVHCKDRSRDVKCGEPGRVIASGEVVYSSSVGAGVVPIKEILHRLYAMGYDGTFAIEHFDSLTMLDDMIASAKFIKENFN